MVTIWFLGVTIVKSGVDKTSLQKSTSHVRYQKTYFSVIILLSKVCSRKITHTRPRKYTDIFTQEQFIPAYMWMEYTLSLYIQPTVYRTLSETNGNPALAVYHPLTPDSISIYYTRFVRMLFPVVTTAPLRVTCQL